jgi:hypothetical protein
MTSSNGAQFHQQIDLFDKLFSHLLIMTLRRSKRNAAVLQSLPQRCSARKQAKTDSDRKKFGSDYGILPSD